METPEQFIRRVEQFGSTAVPGLAAKPIVDMLVEVPDFRLTRARVVPVLESQDYDYFWGPTHGNDGPPFYAWLTRWFTCSESPAKYQKVCSEGVDS